MNTNITHVALDTHKKEHSVAVAYPDTGELEVFTVKNTVRDITKMVKKIQRKALDEVLFCHEAVVWPMGGFSHCLNFWRRQGEKPDTRIWTRQIRT